MPEEKTFIEKTQPINIIDVISKDLLERLIDGYCLMSGRGVAVYYPTKFPENIDDLKLFPLEKWKTIKLLNFAFCRELREQRYYDFVCQDKDKEIVLKYYHKNWRGPKLFHCYLGLWEMTYPLYAGGCLVGVVYGGQIVVAEDVQDWRKTLETVKNEVVWNPFDGKQASEIPKDKINQVDEICKAIDNNKDIQHEDKANLKRQLKQAAAKGGLKEKDLLERYEEFKEFGKTLEKVLEDLFKTKASLEESETAHNLLRTSLRILGHETYQLTRGLDELRKNYLADFKTLNKLDEYKADDLCRDLTGYFQQLQLLFRQVDTAATDLPKPNKEEFWAYKELLFKWRDIYRLDARAKKLQFDIVEPHVTDRWRPRVYGDKMLLEQLVYNLVSNAVKYCYEGTKIKLDCKKADLHMKSPHILTVINYGREFRCQQPWEFGKRGDNVKGVEGVGIGLYNAKRIAKAHKASIEYESTKVSDFNVPIMEPYINSNFDGKNISLSGQIRQELELLKTSKEYDEIISMGNLGRKLYYPQKYEMIDLINLPTYKVAFTVTIPAKGIEK